MTPLAAEALVATMDQAVEKCVEHVHAGGLPFVGVLVDHSGIISGFGVNRVDETGDPSAHAEIVAMREVLSADGREDLSGTVLLATGEPCGLCYRFAIDHSVEAIYVAADREAAAQWGFDYRNSYAALGITDGLRATLFNSLPSERAHEPFIRYHRTQVHRGR